MLRTKKLRKTCQNPGDSGHFLLGSELERVT